MVRDSEMQRRFGAKISVTPQSSSDRQIFLFVGQSGRFLAGLITAQGGKHLLAGPGWVLAELGFSQAISLCGAFGVRMVGGVSIDPETVESLHHVVGLNP